MSEKPNDAQRDPGRIDEVLAIIRDVWIKYPDMRLGQLLVNAANVSDSTDLFSVEDMVLARKVEKLAQRLKDAK